MLFLSAIFFLSETQLHIDIVHFRKLKGVYESAKCFFTKLLSL